MLCQSANLCMSYQKYKRKSRKLLMIERKSSTNRHRYLSNQTKYWFLWHRIIVLLELPNLLSQQLIYFCPISTYFVYDEIVRYMILIILINISCISNGLTGNQDHSKPSEIIHPHCYYSMINVKSSSK